MSSYAVVIERASDGGYGAGSPPAEQRATAAAPSCRIRTGDCRHWANDANGAMAVRG
jgi:hypothetical protein